MLSFTRDGPPDSVVEVSINPEKVLYVMPHPQKGSVIVFSGAHASEPAIVVQEKYEVVVEALNAN